MLIEHLKLENWLLTLEAKELAWRIDFFNFFVKWKGFAISGIHVSNVSPI